MSKPSASKLSESNSTDTRQSVSSKQVENNLELRWVAAWQQKAWWLWLFLPLSWLYGVFMWLRYRLYKASVLSSYRAPIPVMVVGNITVGGSGKTPLIIEIVQFLQYFNINVGVISRGYGGDESRMPKLVTTTSEPGIVGDEPCLIVQETGVAMSVSPNRQSAIELLLEQDASIHLIIADDGLQHYKLQRDIEWIVVDSERGFGNKQLLPTGFLREPISRLKTATVISHTVASTENNDVQSTANEQDENSKKLQMVLQPSEPRPLLSQTNRTENNIELNQPKLLGSNVGKVYAISGIGYPKRFFNTLKKLGFDVIEYPMPDHHVFTAKDLSTLTEYPIITTSKDAVKIAPLVKDNPQLALLSIWVLPVRAKLTTHCYETLIGQLKALDININ